MKGAPVPQKRPPRPAALRVKAAAGERRDEEKRMRREAILQAAKLVYSKKGFLAATIEDIAAAARVSVGAIYMHYRSKEELYVSLLEETVDAFSRELSRILNSRQRPDRKVRAAWDFYYRFRQRSPESYRVFFLFHHESFPKAIPAGTLERLVSGTGRNFAIGAQIVKQAMDAGFYRTGNPREVLDMMWSTFMGIVHLSETRTNLKLSISSMRELHRHAFQWLENGLRVPNSPRPQAERAMNAPKGNISGEVPCA
jgi:AcrR family transcriptional regulator